MASVTVTIPDHISTAMTTHATARGVTVDALITEAFRHLAVDPVTRTPNDNPPTTWDTATSTLRRNGQVVG